MPSPRNASAFSSFTTICSGVCFENFLMVIHSARPQATRTTQNNPLKTNGPKNPDPSNLIPAITQYLRKRITPQQQVRHKGFAEHEAGHLRVRLVMQQPVERMIKRLHLRTISTLLIDL